MSDPASPSPDDAAAIPSVPPAPPAPPSATPAGPPPSHGSAQPVPQGYPAPPAQGPQGYPAPPAQGCGQPPAPHAYAAPPAGYGPPQGYAAPAGYAPPYGAPAYPQRKTDGLAVASLVCAIGGVVFSWTIVLGLACIVAVILGHLSLRRLKTSNEAGYGMAVAGTIIGWVGTGILILVFLFAVVLPFLLFIGFMGAATTYPS